MKFSKTIVCLLILSATFSASAQAQRKTPKAKTVKKTVLVNSETSDVENVPVTKKNTRPAAETPTAPDEKPNKKPVESVKSNARQTAAVESNPVYFYEFAKPEFVVSKIQIEHDENGKGKITFQKKDFAEPVTDPLELSARALERLKAIWQTLNFLDSTENYQSVKDFSHLGTMKFSMKKDGRERATIFNWTDNPDAKRLADEYRKIGQQFIWVFDINVARENQPLDAPRLFDALDALVRREEISDAAQMIPFLKQLSNDERIPLIGRNRATKIIEKVEKEEKKKADK